MSIYQLFLKGGVAINALIKTILSIEFKHTVLSFLFLFTIIYINNNIVRTFDYDSQITIFTTPFVEEFFRFLSFSIGGPVIFIFTSVLAFLEFFMYIMKVAVTYSGNGFWAYTFMRFLCVLSHFAFFAIHYKFYKISLKIRNKYYLLYGLLVSYVAHTVWNSYIAIEIYKLIK